VTTSQNRLATRGLTALAAMRIVAGALAWLDPRRTARVFGLTGDAHYALRLFGIRDVVLGIGTLVSSGSQRRAFAAAGLACDAADGVAGAMGMARNDFDRTTWGAPILVPAVAVAFGAWALHIAGR
jgi:hypothetical protein